MKFLIGVVLGTLGMWAYRGGKVQSLVSSPPEPMQQAYNTIAERITHVVNNDQIRQKAASVQDKVQQAHAPEIVRPTAAEVVGRPLSRFLATTLKVSSPRTPSLVRACRTSTAGVVA